MSPNVGKDTAYLAMAYARAATSRDPEFLEDVLHHLIELRRVGDLPQGEWHHTVVRGGREWWWTIDPATGTGRSAARPPEGAVIGRTLRGRPAGAWPIREEFIRKADELGRSGAAGDLELTVRAIRPGFNRAYVRAFLNSIDGLTLADLGGPVMRMLTELAGLRRRYAADLHLTVGLSRSVTLLGRGLPLASAPLQAERLHRAMFADPGDPIAMLGRVAGALVHNGNADIVRELARQEREDAGRLVEEALEAATLDEHLDTLFGALPPVLASRILYDVLATIGPDPGRAPASRIRHAQEELLVRVSMPFATQILDLNVGGEWRLHLAIIREARSLGGEDAAERAAKNLIESDLLYPRVFRPALLAPRSDTHAAPD